MSRVDQAISIYTYQIWRLIWAITDVHARNILSSAARVAVPALPGPDTFADVLVVRIELWMLLSID